MMRMNALTLKQLRALDAVARGGSLTAAGETLGLTTPAIHTQIKGLEEAVGMKLIQRAADGSGSELTEAGMALRETARRIEDNLSQAAANLLAIQRGQSGRVTLGVVSTGKYFAPRLVKMLQDAHPEIEVALRVGNRSSIIEGVERGTFDLAIMGRPPRHPPVIAEPIGEHPHGLIVPPGHPLIGQGMQLDLLFDQTFLAREQGSGTRIVMSRWLDRIGEGRIYDTLEMDSNETIKQAVMAGLGIAFLSLHTVMDELATGRLVQIDAPGLPLMRHWFLVRREDERTRELALRVWEEIVEMKGAFLPRMEQD
ncbi:MAG: LysR family transcriptional regulator [Thioclava marina]|jgi:Transcriptional regulator|uniref:HTH-type transcriptional regulator CbbR n=1 Tax=Thioclava marina TaxID=1915077 RepID=A0ABX3MQ90_9RHOB|nr:MULTISPECIES: LysR family transcriptional regulator [Thioclava]TNE86800.1 MAG: LysR family transcriptional regulator [Paracoccaceae bacterium]MBC7143830.1 LysR family transcriptional regulator [Thioclava marina]MBD3802213.1 LysR family transcriptional regulator [Thioclava sp.]OOY12394.1 LysR family transcriptional regulator [Thioclava marina]OOY28354.1 LysR family transcriptional regulator [Thioclava sp. L04-15]